MSDDARATALEALKMVILNAQAMEDVLIDRQVAATDGQVRELVWMGERISVLLFREMAHNAKN